MTTIGGEIKENESDERETVVFDSKLKVIKIFAGTKDKLDRFGRKNETYAELVNRLIDSFTTLKNGGNL